MWRHNGWRTAAARRPHRLMRATLGVPGWNASGSGGDACRTGRRTPSGDSGLIAWPVATMHSNKAGTRRKQGRVGRDFSGWLGYRPLTNSHTVKTDFIWCFCRSSRPAKCCRRQISESVKISQAGIICIGGSTFELEKKSTCADAVFWERTSLSSCWVEMFFRI